MPAQQIVWTAEMVRALPDDRRRYEVLDGDLYISPSPSLPHQRVVGNLFVILNKYLQEHAIGEAMPSPSDIEFSPTRMLQPDVFAYQTQKDRPPQSWRDLMPLLLAAEVLSASTAHADRQTKRLIYQSERVPEYWIVDLDARLIERWRPDDERPEIIHQVLDWQPVPGISSFQTDLEEIFGRED